MARLGAASGTCYASISMPRHSLTVNGETVEVDVASDMPLLWVLRDVLGLTGTKYA